MNISKALVIAGRTKDGNPRRWNGQPYTKEEIKEAEKVKLEFAKSLYPNLVKIK